MSPYLTPSLPLSLKEFHRLRPTQRGKRRYVPPDPTGSDGKRGAKQRCVVVQSRDTQSMSTCPPTYF